jgi:hypothetical protein
MERQPSDLVVYKTKSGGQVCTWVRRVVEDGQYYLLDFDNVIAIDSELSDQSRANFSVPDSSGDKLIDAYHKETMIDRILEALRFGNSNGKVTYSKYAGVLRFETVITNPYLLERTELLANEVKKYNHMISKVQENLPRRWNAEIPVELHFPLRQISLNTLLI